MPQMPCDSHVIDTKYGKIIWCAKFCPGMLLCKWHFLASTCRRQFTVCRILLQSAVKSQRAFQISLQIVQAEGTIFTLYISGFCAAFLHIGIPWRMSAFTQGCFSQRHVFTHELGACTNMPLCTGAFTQGCFYPQELLHKRAGISTHRCLYTAMLLHRNAFLHTNACVFTRGFF